MNATPSGLPGRTPSGVQVGPRKKREIGKLVFYLVTFIIAIYK